MENKNILEETPAERLEIFLNAEFPVKADFCKIIGIRYDSLVKYLGADTEKLKRSVLGAKYLKVLPLTGINVAWYLTGQGNMYLEAELDPSYGLYHLYPKEEIFRQLALMSPEQLKEFRKEKMKEIELIDKLLDAINEFKKV
jgi:hypothetical protein